MAQTNTQTHKQTDRQTNITTLYLSQRSWANSVKSFMKPPHRLVGLFLLLGFCTASYQQQQLLQEMKKQQQIMLEQLRQQHLESKNLGGINNSP